MWSKAKQSICTLAFGLLIAASTNAASLNITAPSAVDVGDSFDAQIWGDFSVEGLIAGGITLLWDNSSLQIENVTLELAVDPDLSCPGNVNCPTYPPGATVIVWGGFLSNLIEIGTAGPTLMATVTFTAISETASSPLVMLDNSYLAGGWFGANFTPIFEAVSFTDTSVVVASAPVGGSATGVDIRTVDCKNKSTNQKVQIDINGVTSSWNCEAAGLLVNPGDNIDMKVKGTAR